MSFPATGPVPLTDDEDGLPVYPRPVADKIPCEKNPAAARIRAEGTARLAASGLEVDIRPPHDTELKFIVDSAVKTRWPKGDRLAGITFTAWEALFSPRIWSVIRDGKGLVATASHEGQRVILGYLVLDEFEVVEMLYVKRAFRGAGIGLRLVEASGLDLPLKVASVTGSWKRWVKCHDLPTVHVSDNDRKRWKMERERG